MLPQTSSSCDLLFVVGRAADLQRAQLLLSDYLNGRWHSCPAATFVTRQRTVRKTRCPLQPGRSHHYLRYSFLRFLFYYYCPLPNHAHAVWDASPCVCVCPLASPCLQMTCTAIAAPASSPRTKVLKRHIWVWRGGALPSAPPPRLPACEPVTMVTRAPRLTSRLTLASY